MEGRREGRGGRIDEGRMEGKREEGRRRRIDEERMKGRKGGRGGIEKKRRDK